MVQKFHYMEFDNQPVLIILNYIWWHHNNQQVWHWVQQQGMYCNLVGSVLDFKTHQDCTAFLLRWT